MKAIARNNKVFLNRFTEEYVEKFGIDRCINVFCLLNVDSYNKTYAVKPKPGDFKTAFHQKFGFEKFKTEIESKFGIGSLDFINEISCYFVPKNIAEHKKVIIGLLVERMDVNSRSPKDLIQKFGDAIIEMDELEKENLSFIYTLLKKTN